MCLAEVRAKLRVRNRHHTFPRSRLIPPEVSLLVMRRLLRIASYRPSAPRRCSVLSPLRPRWLRMGSVLPSALLFLLRLLNFLLLLLLCALLLLLGLLLLLLRLLLLVLLLSRLLLTLRFLLLCRMLLFLFLRMLWFLLLLFWMCLVLLLLLIALRVRRGRNTRASERKQRSRCKCCRYQPHVLSLWRIGLLKLHQRASRLSRLKSHCWACGGAFTGNSSLRASSFRL